MFKKNIYTLQAIALCAALAAGCGKKEAASSNETDESPAALSSVDLNSGSKMFNCRGFFYPMSGPMVDETVKVRADSIDKAKEKSESYFAQKKWRSSDCVENTLDTASAKAQTAPKDQYKEIESSSGLLYLYHANSDAPVPYEEIAKTQFSDFANESDVFKRQEALERLKGTIDKNIAEKKGQKFVWFGMDSSLGHFDMESKTFSVKNVQLGNGAYYQFYSGDSSYKVLMNGDTSLLTFKTKSIDDAKVIESTIKGDSKPVYLRLYGQILKAAEMDRSKYVVVEVTGAEVYESDRSGRGASKIILTTME